MKETRYFYVPDAAGRNILPDEEAQHAVRVLRLRHGDEIVLMDGDGTFHEAVIEEASNHRCSYSIRRSLKQERTWRGRLHLAMAPTKMMERNEWMAEKATEVGIDEMTFLDCRFSERRQMKTERIERIVVAAAKQSRKAWMPKVEGMTAFDEFIQTHQRGRRYIAHCYEEVERRHLFDLLCNVEEHSHDHDSDDLLVLIGPEGDFSIDEVRRAVDAGFVSVSLGSSRLRTETAALSAVMMMQLAQRIA